MTTPNDAVQQMRALHKPHKTKMGTLRCGFDGITWPCDIILLLDQQAAQVEALQEELHDALLALENASAQRDGSLAQVEALRGALRETVEHIEELEDAWRRGALSEHDGQGGTRSSRNLWLRVKLRKLLALTPAAALQQQQDRQDRP